MSRPTSDELFAREWFKRFGDRPMPKRRYEERTRLDRSTRVTVASMAIYIVHREGGPEDCVCDICEKVRAHLAEKAAKTA